MMDTQDDDCSLTLTVNGQEHSFRYNVSQPNPSDEEDDDDDTLLIKSVPFADGGTSVYRGRSFYLVGNALGSPFKTDRTVFDGLLAHGIYASSGCSGGVQAKIGDVASRTLTMSAGQLPTQAYETTVNTAGMFAYDVRVKMDGVLRVRIVCERYVVRCVMYLSDADADAWNLIQVEMNKDNDGIILSRPPHRAHPLQGAKGLFGAFGGCRFVGRGHDLEVAELVNVVNSSHIEGLARYGNGAVYPMTVGELCAWKHAIDNADHGLDRDGSLPTLSNINVTSVGLLEAMWRRVIEHGIADESSRNSSIRSMVDVLDRVTMRG